MCVRFCLQLNHASRYVVSRRVARSVQASMLSLCSAMRLPTRPNAVMMSAVINLLRLILLRTLRTTRRTRLLRTATFLCLSHSDRRAYISPRVALKINLPDCSFTLSRKARSINISSNSRCLRSAAATFDGEFPGNFCTLFGNDYWKIVRGGNNLNCT